MFRKLKSKFMIVATISMFLLMLIIVAVMNIINYISIVYDSDEILDVLLQIKEQMPEGQIPSDAPDLKSDYSILRGMSPEVPYESRYFVALLGKDGEIVRSDLTNIITVDAISLEKYATEAFNSNRDRAFIGEFRYSKVNDGKIVCILFLDCGRKLDSFRNFLFISSSVGVGSCVILFILLMFAIGRIVRPIAESYEKQKRFITDAGHEIRTPLTIINTNLDLLEEDYAENEEIADIRLQTKRLTELTNDLVLLSKMEETDKAVTKIELPVTDIVNETISSFEPVAKAKNISLTARVEPDVTLYGSPNAVRQLISILLDNAVKYTPQNGLIVITMSAQKKNWIFTVKNCTATPVDRSELLRIFDRFYRTDSSRNSETGGHGIGLSIAKAITESHDGNITASTKGGCDFCVTVTLPL